MVAAGFPPRWIWLFPLVYGLHLLDERFVGPGVAVWSTQAFGITFTNEAWLAVNVPTFAVLAVATWFVSRGYWPSWVTAALATHVAAHAILHTGASAWAVSWSPGLATSLLACVPLAVATFSRAFVSLTPGQLCRGVLGGVLSFQPLWHAVLLPVLGWESVAAF